MTKHFLFVAILILSVALFSCDKKEENPVDPALGTKTITIQHFGVDFSAGLTGGEITDINGFDGETIAWCPNGNQGGWGIGIWWRPTTEKMYRVGAGNLTDITSVDTTRWSNDVCATPLVNGDLWVTQSTDGYVVFKVLDVATDSASIANDPLWSAKVEYKYSSSINF